MLPYSAWGVFCSYCKVAVKFCLSVCIPKGAVKNAVLQVSRFSQRAFCSRELCLKLQGQFSEGDDILVLWATYSGVNLSFSVTNLIPDSKTYCSDLFSVRRKAESF